jgi:predicted RecB family nuclease
VSGTDGEGLPASSKLRPRRISAGALTTLQKCPRRLWLDVHEPGERAEPSAFDEELRQRGIAHERAVRDGLPGLVGPIYTWQESSIEAAALETQRLLRESRAPLYQPAFVSADGALAGVPDFIEHDPSGGVVVRDAKLLVRLEGRLDVSLQMAHYRALVESTSGLHVTRCEIVNGNFEVVAVPPLDEAEWRARVDEARALLEDAAEPVLLKAHSTCEACPYYEHCWERAEREHRIEIIPSVNRQNLPRLAELEIRTLDELAARALEELVARHLTPGVANNMVMEARAFVEQKPQWRTSHGLPVDRTPVWFDLEGDPLAEVEVPIYLWGFGLGTGDAPLAYRNVIAEAGAEGDRDAWRRFLAMARGVFEAHPDALWVHYAEYERTWLERYIGRHGDPEGTAARIRGALFDLRAALQRAVVLPVRSYGIKTVAQHLGFRWRNPDAGSQWSTVQYQRARATSDPAERARLFASIAEYNEDDQRAMRHVWEWMIRVAPDLPAEPASSHARMRRSRSR